jgi:hypothetical protein
MTHCSDDDLLLEYYGEASRSASHRRGCQACSARYDELTALLDEVRLEPPERGDHYGLEVWQAIRHRLPPRQRSWRDLFDPRWGFAAAAVACLTIGFAAGRLWEPIEERAPQTTVARQAADATDEDGRRRAVLLTVTDHFDRSDRVLAEIMNAHGPQDLSVEQQWARDLVAASRLYRQNVIAINEPALAAVLEEVERVLLDIVHQPSNATAADLDELRHRIDSAALLFKVRVMTSELQYRLGQPSFARPATSTMG